MKKNLKLPVILTVFILLGFSLVVLLSPFEKGYPEASVKPAAEFRLGNEVLLQDMSGLIKDKNIGIITNSSGVLSDGKLFADVLASSGDYNLVKIFSPEHGFEVDDSDYNYVDQGTGAEIISLYGKKKKPSSSDLSDVDVLIYDIQDVGARFYTFINTMYYCMQAATDNNIKFIVCDRPLIPNADYVDGFMLESNVQSFVGLLDIPIAYGMTCGELAKFINTEYLSSRCDLEVIEMDNYTRNTDYESLGLVWVKPSPSMYFPSTANTYQGTCLLEGTNFAEGRGTDKPFEFVGAPYCDGALLKEEMDSYGFEGVKFEAISFVPSSITSPSNPPKFVDRECGGVYINVTDEGKFEAVKVGIALLISLNELFPQFKFKSNNYIDKLSGTRNLKKMVTDGYSLDEIVAYYSEDLNYFKTVRKNFLIYPY